MALKLRMSRQGTKKRPFFHIVVADSRACRDGKFIEKIGVYNPLLPKTNDERVKFDADRAKHWLKMGATPSDRVAIFLGKAGVIPMPKQRKALKKAEPKTKMQERVKAKAEKAAARAAAPVEAAPAEVAQA